jgi:aromatic ring-opening dioxygenase catalytic subunit (LigB family)
VGTLEVFVTTRGSARVSSIHAGRSRHERRAKAGADSRRAARAHPTDDHYLPLLIASGAAQAADSIRVIDGGVTYGVLSMDTYMWGMP